MSTQTPSAEALGFVIRQLREAQSPKMSQGDLADLAEYGKGGAVSISRIERGIVRPQEKRLAAIALALGLTPEQLLAEAVDCTQQFDSERMEPSTSLREQVAATKAWHAKINDRVTGRAQETQEKGEAFNEVHDRARDDIFMKFVAVGSGIGEAPHPEEPSADELASAEEGGARIRIEAMRAGIGSAISGAAAGSLAGAAAGGAAAYGAFTAAAMFGTAGTGTAIASLSGVAATNATLALLGGGTLAAGGAGVAGGTLLLTGLVAAPAAILAVAGFAVLKRQRTKKEDARLRGELTKAEVALDQSQDGYDTMIHVLTEATEILEYASIHGSHALKKWAESLPAEPRHWDDLDESSQVRYNEFLTIASCVLAVSSINVGALLTAEPAALKEMKAAINDTLKVADEQIKAIV